MYIVCTPYSVQIFFGSYFDIVRMPLMDHVHILTLGGTIDKDYPKLTSGYAFEFGEESAAERILKSHPNLGISYEIKSISKKDSLEITQQDWESLYDAITGIIKSLDDNNQVVQRIVVTHGTDTMIDTATFLDRCLDPKAKERVVIAFTGATKPERFVDSDASFNLGCAIAATSVCSPSVVICMNGNVVPCDKCIRDEASGLFLAKSSAR